MRRNEKLLCVLLGFSVCMTVAAADLVGYYTLDGDVDGFYLDFSGNEYHGTLDGSPLYVFPGPDRYGTPNSAMWWDSGARAWTDFIDTGPVEERPLYNETGSLSIATWVYLHGSASGTTSFLAGKVYTTRDWDINVATTGGVTDALRFRISSTGSNLLGAYTTTSFPLDQWVHVTAVYQAGTGAHMRLYINGVEQPIVSDTISESRFSNQKPVQIGGRDGTAQFWFGGIDEFRIYNHALTPSEIEAIIPEVKAKIAWLPNPVDGGYGTPTTDLTWRVPTHDTTIDPLDPNKLSWTYQVYFDTVDTFDNVVTPIDAGQGLAATSSGSVSNALIAPLTLATTYYWRVDAIEPNALGDITHAGDVWMFDAGAAPPVLVDPNDNYTEIHEVDLVLDWISDPLVSFSKVIITPDGDVPIDLGIQVPPFQPYYDAGITMEWGKQYQWQVIELDADGTTILAEGPLWKFRTRTLECVGLIADIDGSGDCVVNLADFAVMASEWLLCGWNDGGLASPCP